MALGVINMISTDTKAAAGGKAFLLFFLLSIVAVGTLWWVDSYGWDGTTGWWLLGAAVAVFAIFRGVIQGQPVLPKFNRGDAPRLDNKELILFAIVAAVILGVVYQDAISAYMEDTAITSSVIMTFAIIGAVLGGALSFYYGGGQAKTVLVGAVVGAALFSIIGGVIAAALGAEITVFGNDGGFDFWPW